GSLLASFFPFAQGFTGGVFVAAADLNGDGHADVIVGAGAGGGPQVNAYSGANLSQLLLSFFAYDQSFTGGVRVGAADADGDGKPDIFTGKGPGSDPAVRRFSGLTGALIDQFFAYNQSFSSGIFVGGSGR